jgi:hypothetical protein
MIVDPKSGRASVVKSSFKGDVLHIAHSSSNETHITTYSSYVRNLEHIILEGDDETLSFHLVKEVFQKSPFAVVSCTEFEGAGGDFPNAVDETTFLVHSVKTPHVVFFDTKTDTVKMRVRLPHANPADVHYFKGYLVYFTLDKFVAFSVESKRIVLTIPIPKRRFNYHASVFPLSSFT